MPLSRLGATPENAVFFLAYWMPHCVAHLRFLVEGEASWWESVPKQRLRSWPWRDGRRKEESWSASNPLPPRSPVDP